MKWKKYVKSVVVFLFTIAVIGLGIFLGIKLLKFFMPFVIGWLIALIANPLVRMLERRLKVARKHTSMFLIIGVLGAIIGGIYLIGVKTVEETRLLIEQAPVIYQSIREDFDTAGENLSMIIEELPQSVQDSIQELQDSVGEMAGKAVSKISQITMDQVE